MFSKDRELHEECGVFAVCGYENAEQCATMDYIVTTPGARSCWLLL